ncbi:hypothetical protein [Paraburkholderia caribensis]|uniref:hypothetical protein n=1 Tax=Paraburkholderia caribensis TaxID=75105 RepID=UPI0034D1C4C1
MNTFPDRPDRDISRDGGNVGSTNGFFRLDGQTKLHKSGDLYAAIEVPARNERRNDAPLHPEPMLFECLDYLWFETVTRNGERLRWSEIFRDAPLAVLELTDYPLDFPETARPGDILWYKFAYETTAEGEAHGRLYANLFGGGTTVRIGFHELLPPGWPHGGTLGRGGWLTREIAANSTTNVASAEVRKMLRRIDASGGVAIYDVGQGACQAALDGDRHRPSLYVDFGGGVMFNRRTYPAALKQFCFSRSPVIVLSHWDWDHWSSAYRDITALSALWLAPPVKEMPIQQAFAADLYTRNRLRIWHGPQPVETGSVTLERCTGSTSNDSGIAVTFKRRTRNFLLPGDADYQYIPSVRQDVSFSGLCLTHHGGVLHSDIYPTPKRGHVSVVSSGPRNTYRHPIFATLAAHRKGGWAFPTPTAMSGQRPCHIHVPWGQQPYVYRGGCSRGACAIAIAAIAPDAGGTVHLVKLPPASKKKKKRTHVSV